MRWSLRIGEVGGIGVSVHLTFFLLIAWVGLSHWLQSRSLGAAVAGIVFILALFSCVLLHEFGHAITAKRFGIRTRDITLLPIGGVARLERMPDKPIQELWVALAGPAVNVVIAALLFVSLVVTGSLEPLANLTVASGSFLERILVVNLFLAGFNMIPAFPMDGGRVLRALLAMRTDYTRATQIAAYLGQGIAFFLGFIGLFSNPFLLFIALFVWIGAAQEASMAQVRSALGGIPVSRAMITDFRSLTPSDSLDRAVALVLAGTQRDFPVVADDRIEGIITQKNLLEALAQGDQGASVGRVMDRGFQVVDSREMLESALARLRDCDCHTLPVAQDGRLIGLLTMENVGEFLRIQAALSRRRER